MSVLLSALAFFVLLTVLILIHEWGHFAAARKAGIVVEEFGFGLPPRAKTLFVHRGTVFSFNWIPFGGFVRLKGENAITERERRSKGSFSAAPIYARLMVLLAGVFMNLLLAIVLLTIGFSIGRWIPTYTSLEAMRSAADRGEIHLTLGVAITEVVSGGPAAKIGLPPQSVLFSVDGIAVTAPEQVAELQQGKTRVTYVYAPLKEYQNASARESITLALESGKTGVSLTPFPLELSAPRRNVFDAFILTLREIGIITVQTVYGIGRLFTSLFTTGVVPEGVSGIVGIAQLTYASVQEGFMTYLRLVALLSLSLAVLNVLPFPALDGGRVFFVLLELVSRKPVNRHFEMATNAVGFTFLILLIVLITFYDIVRLF